MAAMTMPYKVRDAKELADIKPGDLITSTLVVVSNDAYLKDVKKVGEAPLASALCVLCTSASSGFELLKPGEPVPDVPFLDQEGRKTSLASLKGQTVVLTFIYTQCPMPTFCPLMDRHFVTIQERLKADPALARVHLATVSFDPVTDTPPVLKKHAEQLGADTSRWTFFTGDRDDVDRFASRFGVTIARDVKDPLNITHNLRTAIIDRRRQAGEGLHRQRMDARSDPRGSEVVRTFRSASMTSASSGSASLSPRERRLIARLRTPLAVQRYLNPCPTTRSRRPRARRCGAFAASCAAARRTASRRRCSRRWCSSSTAIRRWS